jgi:hypothetical protein
MSSVTETITSALGKQEEMHLPEERQVLVNDVTGEDVNSDHVPGDPTPNQTTKTKTQLHPSEKWHYHCINGLGENVQFDFDYQALYEDYQLPVAENDLLGRADPNPTVSLRHQNTRRYTSPVGRRQ